MSTSKGLTSALLIIAVLGLVGTGYFYLQAQDIQKEKKVVEQKNNEKTKAIKKEPKPKELTDKDDPLAHEPVPGPDDEKAYKDEEAKQEANIIVAIPSSNEAIASPVRVTGKARTFENTVTVKIKDSTGKALKEAFTTAVGEMGVHSEFTIEVAFDKGNAKSGTIEVFQYSAKDGTEIDKVIVPVTFR